MFELRKQRRLRSERLHNAPHNETLALVDILLVNLLTVFSFKASCVLQLWLLSLTTYILLLFVYSLLLTLTFIKPGVILQEMLHHICSCQHIMLQQVAHMPSHSIPYCASNVVLIQLAKVHFPGRNMFNCGKKTIPIVYIHKMQVKGRLLRKSQYKPLVYHGRYISKTWADALHLYSCLHNLQINMPRLKLNFMHDACDHAANARDKTQMLEVKYISPQTGTLYVKTGNTRKLFPNSYSNNILAVKDAQLCLVHFTDVIFKNSKQTVSYSKQVYSLQPFLCASIA